MIGRAFSPSARSYGIHALRRVTDTSGTSIYFEFELPVPGGGSSGVRWAYAVPDDASDLTRDVVLSIAYDGDVYLALLDLSSLRRNAASGDVNAARASISWSRLALPAAATARGYTGVADHAHVAAFGSHWISAQLAGGPRLAESASTLNDLWLFRVDRRQLGGGGTIAPDREVLVYASDYNSAWRLDPLVSDTARAYATNDHFMVATPEGVAVAIKHVQNKALRFLVVDPRLLLLTADVTFLGTVGSPTKLECDTTGSARGPAGAASPAAWRVMVPDTVLLNVADNVLQVFDTDASLSDATILGRGTPNFQATLPGYSLQMPSFVRLPNGDSVLALKLVPCSTAATGPTYSDNSPVVDDWGYLWLAVWDATFSSMSSPVPLQVTVSSTAAGAPGGNRPHVSRWGNFILTCWEEADLDSTKQTAQASNFRSYLRVDVLVPS